MLRRGVWGKSLMPFLFGVKYGMADQLGEKVEQ
jgi:hypothetical protein